MPLVCQKVCQYFNDSQSETMSAQYRRIQLCSEGTLKSEQHPSRLRATKSKVGGIQISYQTRNRKFIAHLESEYLYTYVYIHTTKLSSWHIWNDYYVCVCIYMHTQYVCISKYIHIYYYHYPQGTGLSTQLLRNRADWPFASSRMSQGRILCVAGSQYDISVQLDQEDNTHKATRNRNKSFQQNCVGGLKLTCLFFIF